MSKEKEKIKTSDDVFQPKMDETVVGDEYDVFGKAIKVHTKSLHDWINEDFKLSDLTKNEKIVTERSVVIINHIISLFDYTRFLQPRKLIFEGKEMTPDEVVQKKAQCRGYSPEQVREVKIIANKIQTRMVNTLQAKAILSSAREGRIVKAIMERLKQQQQRIEVEEKMSDRLKPKDKDDLGGGFK